MHGLVYSFIQIGCEFDVVLYSCPLEYRTPSKCAGQYLHEAGGGRGGGGGDLLITFECSYD